MQPSSLNPLQSESKDEDKSSVSKGGLLKGTIFEKRHKDDFSYEPIPTASSNLFAPNGELLYSELIKVEAVCAATNAGERAKGGNELYKPPIDDPEARVQRVKSFLGTVAPRCKPLDDYDSFQSALVDDEKIAVVLDCSHISGLPTQTDDSLSLMGKIKIALVQSSIHGSRLLFSVAEGSTDISIRDSFVEVQTEQSCICCCIQMKQPNGKYSINSVYSTMDIKYDIAKLFTAQFFSLPLEPCFVDAMCYQASADEFTATSTGAASANNISTNCADMQCGCNEDCCSPDCKVPVICGVTKAVGTQSVTFSAEEHYDIVTKGTLPIIDAPTESVDGVQMNITASNTNHIYVVLHYRSVLDNDNHTCKVKLSYSENPSEAYDLAKQFVSKVSVTRKPPSPSYFEDHPLKNYRDPIMRAKRFDRELPPDQHESFAFDKIGSAFSLISCLNGCSDGTKKPPTSLLGKCCYLCLRCACKSCCPTLSSCCCKAL